MNRTTAGILQQCTVPADFLLPTTDPNVFIEEQADNYIRYCNSNGQRWEIFGTCDKRGNCLVGAVIDGEVIATLEDARKLAKSYTGLDVPVTPNFKGCCPLKGRWLDA